MAKFCIRSVEQALDIVKAWERCDVCYRCPLSTPEGWRCGYLHDRALAYLKRHGVKPDGTKSPSAR